MLDTVHTNRERIQKIHSLFDATEELLETIKHKLGPTHLITQHLLSLRLAAIEAEGSLQAIEKFLEERDALDNKE